VATKVATLALATLFAFSVHFSDQNLSTRFHFFLPVSTANRNLLLSGISRSFQCFSPQVALLDRCDDRTLELQWSVRTSQTVPPPTNRGGGSARSIGNAERLALPAPSFFPPTGAPCGADLGTAHRAEFHSLCGVAAVLDDTRARRAASLYGAFERQNSRQPTRLEQANGEKPTRLHQAQARNGIP